MRQHAATRLLRRPDRKLRIIAQGLLVAAGLLPAAVLDGGEVWNDPGPADHSQPPPRDDRRPPPREGRPPGPERGRQAYSLEQALSDQAQLHTISFSCLAFLTGDFAASTFIPPGKVCDFFGFQYLRDIDAQGGGHNPRFLDRIVGNVATILDRSQQKMLLELAQEQAPGLEALARARLPVILAFHMASEGRVPAGRQALDQKAVSAAVGAIFRQDARLSLRRAQVMAAVALSLTPAQQTALAPMRFGDSATWPDRGEVREVIRETTRGLDQMTKVAFMTYASELFSWIKGSVEADTYFCPERHGTYFGGFCLKDLPAMGKKDYDISTSLTGESGRRLVEEILDGTQRELLTSLISAQRPALAGIATTRQAIATRLRRLLDGQAADEEEVLALGERYGQLDGECSWRMVVTFARINTTLTETQRLAMRRLRNLDAPTTVKYYIYSRPVGTPIDLAAAAEVLFTPSHR